MFILLFKRSNIYQISYLIVPLLRSKPRLFKLTVIFMYTVLPYWGRDTPAQCRCRSSRPVNLWLCRGSRPVKLCLCNMLNFRFVYPKWKGKIFPRAILKQKFQTRLVFEKYLFRNVKKRCFWSCIKHTSKWNIVLHIVLDILIKIT